MLYVYRHQFIEYMYNISITMEYDVEYSEFNIDTLAK
jgi:hypothetical protein